ncbi:MAG: hypothetical protein NVS1B10_04980 [Candidatus Saccharimonadales bacterium]
MAQKHELTVDEATRQGARNQISEITPAMVVAIGSPDNRRGERRRYERRNVDSFIKAFVDYKSETSPEQRQFRASVLGSAALEMPAEYNNRLGEVDRRQNPDMRRDILPDQTGMPIVLR